MNVTIRSLAGEAMLDALYPLDQYAFRPSPPFMDREEWQARVRARQGIACFAAFEDEAPVSIAVSSSMTQNIRGALYPAAGIWGVASHPGARRKGYVRQTIASLLAAERENGKIFTALWPFRESFYERLGYVTYPLMKSARFSPQALAPLLKQNLGGEVELRLLGEAFDAYRGYLSGLRRERHGMILFDHGYLSPSYASRSWVALATFDGTIEGVMVYALQGEEITRFNFAATRFYYQTARARCLLLNWIARHVDQADRVEIWLPGDETPETWLADLQVKFEAAPRAAMGRVLDLAKIDGMQVGEGGFTARVSDPLCPWNEGIWRFEGCGGKLAVEQAEGQPPDCELTIQGLTALINGAHDPGEYALRGWGTADARVQAVQRRLFPRMWPYLHENF